MSRSRFPRVASRTRPKPTRPQLVKLPPLLYGIYDADGELERICEADDPRSAICSKFNEWIDGAAWGRGQFALPITDRADLTPIRRRRKAVSQ